MVKRPLGALVLAPQHEPADVQRARYRDLYERLRTAIRSGVLRPGERLPSSRTLMRDLGLSRTTVDQALAQLAAEGLIVRRVGAGTSVARALPEHERAPVRPPSAGAAQPLDRAAGTRALAARGRTVAGAAMPFRAQWPHARSLDSPGLDVSSFPMRTWQRLLARRTRGRGTSALLRGVDPAGYRPLREAISSHLSASRGVRCTWEQVLVLSGIQQALALSAQLLIDPDERWWHEEPGSLGARAVFAACGATAVPVRVDADGLNVAAGMKAAPRARLAYVTPSHQYPLGVTMPLARRLELLAWARATDAWVFEDDYDSELRYEGRPVAALQGMDAGQRVIYAGTFNTVLCPALRTGYVVLPADLVEPFAATRALVDGYAPPLTQAVLADFIAEGHLAAHLRQVRSGCAERRDACAAAVLAALGPDALASPAHAGLHMTARLPREVDDVGVVAALPRFVMDVRPLSPHYQDLGGAPGVILGFATAQPDAIQRDIAALSERISRARPGGAR